MSNDMSDEQKLANINAIIACAIEACRGDLGNAAASLAVALSEVSIGIHGNVIAAYDRVTRSYIANTQRLINMSPETLDHHTRSALGNIGRCAEIIGVKMPSIYYDPSGDARIVSMGPDGSVIEHNWDVSDVATNEQTST